MTDETRGPRPTPRAHSSTVSRARWRMPHAPFHHTRRTLHHARWPLHHARWPLHHTRRTLHPARCTTHHAPSPHARPSFDVIALGGCCWDYLGIVPRYPGLDEKVAISELSMQGGGQAGTGIAAVARLGGRAAIFSRIGDDEFGRHIRESFEAEGVDTRGLVVVPGATSQFAFCAIDAASGKRTIFYVHGTKGKFAPEELDRAALLDCRCLLVDGHHNVAAAEAVWWAREGGVPVVLDLERPQAEDEELVSHASHPVLPEDFALQFTGARDAEAAARAILALGPEVVVVTRGADGCLAATAAGVIHQPALPVEPIVDTTGAGDVFHGAFAYGIALGYDLRENLRFASAVAALKCRALGGRAGIPTMTEVREFLAQLG